MTIWTTEIDYNDWKDGMEDMYSDKDGFSEEDRVRIMHEINDDFLQDLRIRFHEEVGDIVMIADLGLWNGRRSGHKHIGTNLKNIFDSACGNYVTWYTEDGELKCKDTHHDGTNYYTYRLLTTSEFEFDEYAYEHSLKEAVEKYSEPLGNHVAEKYELEEKYD